MSIGELLVERGVITPEQLTEAEAVGRRQGQRLDRVLLEMGYVDEATLLRALGEQLSIPFVDLTAEHIDVELLQSMPAKLVHRRGLLPLSKADGTLRIATSDPFDVYALDELRMLMGCHIDPVLASRVEIDKLIKAHFGVGGQTIETLIDDQSSAQAVDLTAHLAEEDKNLLEAAQEASVVKLVNEIMVEAINERASDIHLEPYEGELQVRYRIDGVLHRANVPPQISRFQAAIISRVKIMAGLNIAEKRLPQDGRIKVKVSGREIDIRVSIIPMLFGEGVVLRILDKKSLLLNLRDLGMAPETYELFETIITRPHGILLVTGPTGSGKTTTLYAAISEIVSESIKTITVEDPVEYHLVGVNQIQVQPKVGLTFARGLRSILRHDPDVIMVGEIRDHETAQLAVRAALTGHLVFSTIHTNDAPGVATRLINMSIEPFLLASSLVGAISQRLARRICEDCKQPHDIPAALRKRLKASGITLPARAWRGAGCPHCRNTGYSRRIGVFELMAVTTAAAELIATNAPTVQLHAQACRDGMVSMLDDGLAKVEQGITTIEEVLRIAELEGVVDTEAAPSRKPEPGKPAEEEEAVPAGRIGLDLDDYKRKMANWLATTQR